jgi:alkylation response protein AidB-like acyl-CoA dehydrogenase
MIVDLISTDDQRMIEDAVREFLRDRLPVERLRDAKAAGGAQERALWDELADLGLFGLGIAESAGGLGLGLAEEALVARALGLNLVSPALLAQIVAPHLAETQEARTALIAGSTRAALANRLDAGTGHLLDGEGADYVVLLDAEGSALLRRDGLGVAEPVSAIDETVALERVAITDTRTAPGAGADRASLLIAAYLAGIAQAVTSMAVDYAGTREQFGQPIGAFQAIKHQCADMATRAAAAEAQVFHAAVTFSHGQDETAEIAGARMLAAEAAFANAKANIQIHGGMGFTAECDAHLFLKRAHIMVELGGGLRQQRRRVLGMAPRA